MIRKASIMKIFDGSAAEYKKRHDEIWPEMVKMLKDYGAHNYSIFLNENTNELFAYLEIEDEALWNSTSRTEICRKWWDYMADIMETNPDNSPVSLGIKEVFHLD